MRRFSIKYTFSQAFQGLWRNGVMTVASLAVLMSCLVVIGGFFLLVQNINLNLDSLGSLTQIVCFVDEELDEDGIFEVEQKIKALDNVTSVKHTTKAEALAELKAEDPEGYKYIDETNNPLVDEFEITYADVTKVVDLDYALKNMEGIEKVNNRLDLASQLESFRSGIILIFTWFLVVLVVVTVFIIVNTIKLSVYARRHEVTVMRYVGATASFVTMPFVIEGIIIGIISAILAYIIEWNLYVAIEEKVASDLQMLSVISFSEMNMTVLLSFIGMGAAAGIIGSLLSLRKYMKV